MELRRVDPRMLKENPAIPRNIQPGEMSDDALAASIRHRHPPAAGRAEKNGELDVARLRRATRQHSHQSRPSRDRRPRQRPRRPQPHARRQRKRHPRPHVDTSTSGDRSKVSPPRTGRKRRSPPRSRFPCARSASCVCSRPSTPPFSTRSARETCRKNKNCAPSPRPRAKTRPRCGRS